MKVDLHTHTTFSDGLLDPERLVSLARNCGVDFFSVTDHDCLEAISIARQAAEPLGISFVTGVELNTDWKGGEIHILGYGFDENDRTFQEKLEEQRRYRKTRLKEMLRKLQEVGYPLDEKRVFEIAGNGSAGRPHLALALIEKKYVETVQEAFDRFLAYGKPAWVPRSRFTPKEAIEAIAAAGGIPVLAHPGRAGDISIEELVGYGLKGIEVFYPSHPPELVEELLAAAARMGLLVTAGSDYHGLHAGETGPGCVEMPERFALELRRAFFGKRCVT